jgi:hypothetical protein
VSDDADDLDPPGGDREESEFAQRSKRRRRKQLAKSKRRLALADYDHDIWEEREDDPRHEETARTGCFIVHATMKKNRATKEKNEYESVKQLNGFMPLVPSEKKGSVSARSDAFQRAWGHVETVIQEVVTNVNQASFNSIKEYIALHSEEGHLRRTLSLAKSRCLTMPLEQLSAMPANVVFPNHHVTVPTALVFTEGSLADQSFLFKQLTAQLAGIHSSSREGKNTTIVEPDLSTSAPFVTVLKAKSFTTSKIALQLIVSTLLQRYPYRNRTRQTNALWQQKQQLWDVGMSKPNTKLKTPVLSLVSWYHSHVYKEELLYDMDAADDVDITTINIEEETILQQLYSNCVVRKPIVIMFEDVESCNRSALAGLLLMFQSNALLVAIGVTFVFGMSTHLRSLHKLLPARCLSALSFQSFCLQPSRKCMDIIFERIIVSSACPVQLGPQSTQFLLDLFYRFDFSIYSFVNALRYVLLDHFDTQLWSQVCTPTEGEASVSTMMRQAPICDFPSFVLESETETDTPAVFDQTPDNVQQCVTAVHHHRKLFHVWFDLLHTTCVFLLPSFKGSANRRKLYLQVLGHSISDLNEVGVRYKAVKIMFINLQKNCAISDLKTLLSTLLSLLQSYNAEFTTEEEQELYAETCDRLIELHTEVNTALTSKTPPKQQQQQQQTPKLTRQNSNSRAALTAIARASMAQKNELRHNVARWFGSLCNEHLKPLTTFPMYEAFWYDVSGDKLMSNFRPCFRSAVHTALTNPSTYLTPTKQPTVAAASAAVATSSAAASIADNEALWEAEGKFEELTADSDDVAVVYQLFLEAPKRINTLAWYNAFTAVYTANILAPTEAHALAPQLQARFNRATDTLRAFGLISKSSGSKADHFINKISFVTPE